MKIISDKSKDCFKIFLLSLSALYLAYVNYSLGFLNGDEIGFVGSFGLDGWNSIKTTIETARLSQILSFPLSVAFIPQKIDLLYLTPRYITALLFIITAYQLFKRYITPVWAMTLSAFVVVSSQLDYNGIAIMFNGLISYGGVFSLFFCFFVWSIFVNNISCGEKLFCLLRYLVALLLCIFSFGSEAFVPATFIYIFSDAFLNRKKLIEITQSPHLMALFLYFIGSVYLYFKIDTLTSNRMSNYLTSGLASHGFLDIVKAGLIFFIYSIPFYNKIELSFGLSIFLSLTIIVFFVLVLLIIGKRLLTYKEFSPQLRYDLPLLISLFSFSIIIGVLLGTRQDRLERALTLEWTRYIYSPYVWLIILLMVCVAWTQIFSNFISNLGKKIGLYIVICILVFIATASLAMNIININSDYNNIRNWYTITHAIDLNKEQDTVSLKESLMIPSRLVGWELGLGTYNLAKRYFKSQYKKHLLVCSDNPLSQPSTNVSREGEYGGWTTKKEVKIPLPDGIKIDDIVELEISDIFGHINKQNPTLFFFDNDPSIAVSRIISRPGIVRITSTTEAPKIFTMIVPDPISPKSLTLSEDGRTLGFWINRMKIKRNYDGVESDIQMMYCI